MAWQKRVRVFSRDEARRCDRFLGKHRRVLLVVAIIFGSFVECQTAVDVAVAVKSKEAKASAILGAPTQEAYERALSPRALDLTDARTLRRLQLKEQLMKSLFVTSEERAGLAALEQVALGAQYDHASTPFRRGCV